MNLKRSGFAPGIILVALAVASLCRAQSVPPPTGEVAPTPEGLLQDVRARLPHERLRIEGDLNVREWGRGVVQQRLTFDAILDLAASPSLAQYTLRDSFGRELEQLTVTREPGESPQFSFASGQPLVMRPAPDLTRAIRGTDISWMDLTLSFLWWSPQPGVTRDEVRGRPCYVITVSRPASVVADPDAPDAYSTAKLWIDQKVRVLMQAEARDDSDNPTRRLWVKSIKKVNGRWMVKDMEVAGPESERRTRLSVREVTVETEQNGAPGVPPE